MDTRNHMESGTKIPIGFDPMNQTTGIEKVSKDFNSLKIPIKTSETKKP